MLEKICPGLDLRSDLGDALRVYKAVSSINNSLDRCTVIEGNVHLLLIGPGYFRNRTEYNAVRFSRLREITVEIGLSQLREISRGGIRISNNPKLCYVETVNWSLINKGGTVVIDNNKSLDLCGLCNASHASQANCAKSNEKTSPACWNYAACQKTCQNQYIACDANSSCHDFYGGNSICCHPECRAGCTGSTASDCIACKNVLVNGSCQKSCPVGYYKYLERRCLTADQCRAVETTPFEHYGFRMTSSSAAAVVPTNDSLSSPFHYDEEEDDGPPTVFFKPIDSTNSCSPICPHGYEEDPRDRHSCRKCPTAKGCTKICSSTSLISEGIIYSVADAQRLRGCTVIRGHLDISIYSSLSVSERHLD
uniref:receptor protein-tyrosine kinase n=1 Tax=Romanomermis culicivorax TaxID=13658 RepID=A0A915HN06_ROMCU